MAIGIIYVAVVLGLFLTGGYLNRRRRVPTLAEVAEDVVMFNRGLEMELAQRSRRISGIQRLLRQAGLGSGERLVYVASSMLLLALVGFYLAAGLLPGMMTRVIVGLLFAMLPLLLVLQRAAARNDAVSAQLPQVLTDMIPPLMTGTRRVEDCFKEFVLEQRVMGPGGKQERVISPAKPGPLGPELFRVYHDITFGGLSLSDAVRKSIRRIEHPGYEDLLISIVAAARSSSPAKELTDLRVALEKERGCKREVASTTAMMMMEGALVPAVGLVGLVVMRFMVPNADQYLTAPAGQIGLALAWVMGAANVIRARRVSQLSYILRRIEI